MKLGWVAVVAIWGGLLHASDSVEACGAELHAMPGVWISRDRALPIYYDIRLVAYLASLGRRLNAGRNSQSPVAILPAYSSAVLCFTRNNSVFVSTGLLLGAENEQDLERRVAAQLANVHGRRGSGNRVSSCALLTSPSDQDFASLREELARQVERYEESTRPRLRIRIALARPTGG